MSDLKLKDLLREENQETVFERLKPFQILMMQYNCALLEVETKFRVLNNELAIEAENNPILSMQSRIKKPISILDKLNRKNLEPEIENIEGNIKDIAGIRVICAFIKDIYTLADKICSQDDIVLVEKKDYIKNPKKNGYRSLHLILEVPVFFMNETKNMKVEVQLRTIAMDSWASLEHKMKYKKNIQIDSNEIEKELKECAETLSMIDLKMQDIDNKIHGENQQ